MLANHQRTLDANINAFRKRCENEGVPVRIVEVVGVPVEQIDNEADRHDLIIVGRDTNFHGVKGHDIGDVVQQLLKDNPRPVIVVPPEAALPGKGAMIAFDGSIPSSRAMHMFHLMGLANGGPIHIISVDQEDENAETLAARGAAFFKSHGMEVKTHALEASSEIAQTILNTAESLEVGMLVMGAFSKRSLMHQIFVGSVTKQLIRVCQIPVFVYH